MQLVDELSMIYTCALSCYASFSYRKSNFVAFLVAIFFVSLSIFITGYYHYLQDPAFHQNAFAIMTITVLLRSMYTMELTLRPALRQRQSKDALGQQGPQVTPQDKTEQGRQDKRDMELLKTMWYMVGWGLVTFLGGFAIWSLDNVHCSTLRRWRREVGLPWGILLEGHGWW